MSRAVALIEKASPDAARVVSVRGEIDVGSTPALRDWLTRASEGGRCSVVLDLRGVSFLAVSGLYVLCDEQHRMADHQARLTIVCTDRRALQLFEVCRLDGALDIVPRPDEACDGPWNGADTERAGRLAAWMERYSSAESA
jgi:anti-sigma B factor antagonist